MYNKILLRSFLNVDIKISRSPWYKQFDKVLIELLTSKGNLPENYIRDKKKRDEYTINNLAQGAAEIYPYDLFKQVFTRNSSVDEDEDEDEDEFFSDSSDVSDVSDHSSDDELIEHLYNKINNDCYKKKPKIIVHKITDLIRLRDFQDKSTDKIQMGGNRFYSYSTNKININKIPLCELKYLLLNDNLKLMIYHIYWKTKYNNVVNQLLQCAHSYNYKHVLISIEYGMNKLANKYYTKWGILSDNDYFINYKKVPNLNHNGSEDNLFQKTLLIKTNVNIIE